MTGTGDSEAAAVQPVAATVQPVEATDARDAATVLRRLERIEALDRAHAPAGQVLGELRKLVREAEAWARCEGDERARAAVGNLREEAEGMR